MRSQDGNTTPKWRRNKKSGCQQYTEQINQVDQTSFLPLTRSFFGRDTLRRRDSDAHLTREFTQHDFWTLQKTGSRERHFAPSLPLALRLLSLSSSRCRRKRLTSCGQDSLGLSNQRSSLLPITALPLRLNLAFLWCFWSSAQYDQ